METRRRILAKALTWQVMGFLSMTAIGAFFTGSVTSGGGIAIAGSIAGFIGYFLHETAWAHVMWGQVVRRREERDDSGR